MVNFWQVSNVALKSSHWRCSIKKPVLEKLAILNLCWSLFLINLQAYKPATLLQRDSNIDFFLWILRYFRNLYLKGHLWTTTSELYWFKVEEIIEKTETYPETIIGEVFRIHWNIKDKAFCKKSCFYLTVDYFCKKHFILIVPQSYEYALMKLNSTAISANLFLNYILSSHYYLAVRH